MFCDTRLITRVSRATPIVQTFKVSDCWTSVQYSVIYEVFLCNRHLVSLQSISGRLVTGVSLLANVGFVFLRTLHHLNEQSSQIIITKRDITRLASNLKQWQVVLWSRSTLTTTRIETDSQIETKCDEALNPLCCLTDLSKFDKEKQSTVK